MQGKRTAPRARAEPEGFVLTQASIDRYMERVRAKGRTQTTQATYRRWLNAVYDSLPEDKAIRQGTLEELRQRFLQSGYAPQTVNGCMTAINGLLGNEGQRALQLPDRLELNQTATPELTRTEYLRLLSVAKTLGKEREYLLIKIFATVGISVQDLNLITVEAAERGRLTDREGIKTIPDCLKGELLHYARREGVASGPIFLSGDGKPIGRTMVTHWTQSLCKTAKVEQEKASPRCLRNLYRSTQEGIRQSLAVILQQTYDRLLETEQLSIGWGE